MLMQNLRLGKAWPLVAFKGMDSNEPGGLISLHEAFRPYDRGRESSGCVKNQKISTNESRGERVNLKKIIRPWLSAERICARK